MAITTPEVLVGETKRDIRGRTIIGEERWQELVAACESSGLTQAQFARREGINYHTLVAKLARCRRQKGASPVAGSFIEARVPTVGWADPRALEVQLPGWIVVRGGDVAAVAALVQALGRTA
jgi:hypothetical protein